MKIIRQSIAGIPKVLLFLLFIYYNSSLTLFYHAHKINGTIVFHSHPYKRKTDNKSPVSSHQHTPADFFYIHQLDKSIWEPSPDIPAVPANYSIIISRNISYKSPDKQANTPLAEKLRAPPSYKFRS